MQVVRIALGVLASVSLSALYVPIAELGKSGHAFAVFVALLLPWPLATLGWIRIVRGPDAGAPRLPTPEPEPAGAERDGADSRRVARIALALGLAQLATNAALDAWIPYELRYATPWWQLVALVPWAAAPSWARALRARALGRALDAACRLVALATTLLLVAQGATIGWLLAASRRDETRRADVAIVLGFGLDDAGRPRAPLVARLLHGVSLYRRGVVPRLLVTGGGEPGRTEADVMRALALRAGVPDEAILREPEARSTEENIERSLALMRRHHLRTALLVSEPYHLPRAVLLARRHGLDAHPSASPLGWPGPREQTFWVLREARHVMLLALW